MTTPNVRTADERTILTVSLARHRAVVLWKLEGLDDEQLRRRVVPSGTSLLGLVKHLGGVEYGWFCETFGQVELDIVREMLDGATGDHRRRPPQVRSGRHD